MPKGARIWIGLSVGLQLIWSLPLAVSMYATGNLALALVFGALSLLILVATVLMILRWRSTDARERSPARTACAPRPSSPTSSPPASASTTSSCTG